MPTTTTTETANEMCRACKGKGTYPGLDITCRSCHGDGMERPVRLYEEVAGILSNLADDLEAIDRKHGVEGYDYSNLRMPLEVV